MSYRRKLELLRRIEDEASDESVPTWVEEPILAAVRELRGLIEHNSLDDLNPDRLHPPTQWLAEQTTYDADAGVYYEPFVKDGRVGYRVASNRPGIGQEAFIYLYPSDGSDDGVPNVFVYQGIENDPAVDQPDDHHVIKGVGYEPGEQPVEGAEAEHAAWVAERRVAPHNRTRCDCGHGPSRHFHLDGRTGCTVCDCRYLRVVQVTA